MNEDKFHNFLDCFDNSFREIAWEMSELRVSKCNEIKIASDRKFSVIVGIVPANRGRILFEAEQKLVDRITEGMNGEPLGNIMYTYFYLTEFANIFCGKALSKMNDLYRDSEWRLTPPALFVGSSMRIITPSIHSQAVYYSSEAGGALLDIGMEGV
jgi:CheY-specific phosphatase CheX